jgi:hypothetical protein
MVKRHSLSPLESTRGAVLGTGKHGDFFLIPETRAGQPDRYTDLPFTEGAARKTNAHIRRGPVIRITIADGDSVRRLAQVGKRTNSSVASIKSQCSLLRGRLNWRLRKLRQQKQHSELGVRAPLTW